MKTAAAERNDRRIRKQTERQRKRDLGLAPLEIWSKPEHKEAIKQFVRELHEN